jgi:hypothetical protein
MRHHEGHVLKDQAYRERIGAPPRNPVECGTANPIVRTFWRFAAFFRCLHVVIVCTPDLPSHHRSSVIYSSLKDYRQKPVETLDTDLTASITNGVSLLHTK